MTQRDPGCPCQSRPDAAIADAVRCCAAFAAERRAARRDSHGDRGAPGRKRASGAAPCTACLATRSRSPRRPPMPPGTRLTIVLPNDAAAQANFPAGLWQLTITLHTLGRGPPTRDTNAVPLVLAPAPVIAADPVLGLPAANATRGGVPPRVTVTLASRPQVRLEQRASLLLDDCRGRRRRRALRLRIRWCFIFPNTVTPGAHSVRLRVDGTDSVLLDRSGPVPPLRPYPADHGAGMTPSLPVQTTGLRPEPPINPGRSANQRWLAAAISGLRERLAATGGRRRKLRRAKYPTAWQPGRSPALPPLCCAAPQLFRPLALRTRAAAARSRPGAGSRIADHTFTAAQR